jgi:hypothetical protein
VILDFPRLMRENDDAVCVCVYVCVDREVGWEGRKGIGFGDVWEIRIGNLYIFGRFKLREGL